MQMRTSRLILLAALLAAVVLASGASAQDTSGTTSTSTEPTRLVVWWPEPLAPAGNTDVENMLMSHFRDFEQSQGNVIIDFRRKAVTDPGGIMPTLRTASVVAPGALPDVTLIRREDMLSAKQGGLIQQLERLVPTSMLVDLESTLKLGQVDGVLYGLPYLLDVRATVYRTNNDKPLSGWSFDDVLSRNLPFAFPANKSSGVSNVFFVQYLDAGGSVSADGTLVFNRDALETVLSFYEQAVQKNLVDQSVLGYSAPSDYLSMFTDGLIDMGIFNSSTYLSMQASGETVFVAPLPTQSGDPASVLTGWVWVMITGDTHRQELVEQFLTSMMDPDTQEAYARAVNMLPSQQTVLNRWFTDVNQASALQDIVSSATLPIADSAGGPVVRAMQSALVSVLNGSRTAQQATQDVIDQIGGSSNSG